MIRLARVGCGSGNQPKKPMKWRWLDRVRLDPALPPLAFKIGYVIADLVDEERGFAWPSIARLMEETASGESGVKSARKALETHGYLNIKPSTGRGNACEYRLKMPIEKGGDLQPLSSGKGGRKSTLLEPSKGGDLQPLSGRKGSANGGKGSEIIDKGVGNRPPTQLNTQPKIQPKEIDSLAVSKDIVPVAPDPFPRFWHAYPRSIGRVAAKRAFERAIANGTDPNDIIAGAEAFAAYREQIEPDPVKRERFTPHPATWLNAGRWADDLPAISPSTATGRMYKLAGF